MQYKIHLTVFNVCNYQELNGKVVLSQLASVITCQNSPNTTTFSPDGESLEGLAARRPCVIGACGGTGGWEQAVSSVTRPEPNPARFPPLTVDQTGPGAEVRVPSTTPYRKGHPPPINHHHHRLPTTTCPSRLHTPPFPLPPVRTLLASYPVDAVRSCRSFIPFPKRSRPPCAEWKLCSIESASIVAFRRPLGESTHCRG